VEKLEEHSEEKAFAMIDCCLAWGFPRLVLKAKEACEKEKCKKYQH